MSPLPGDEWLPEDILGIEPSSLGCLDTVPQCPSTVPAKPATLQPSGLAASRTCPRRSPAGPASLQPSTAAPKSSAHPGTMSAKLAALQHPGEASPSPRTEQTRATGSTAAKPAAPHPSDAAPSVVRGAPGPSAWPKSSPACQSTSHAKLGVLLPLDAALARACPSSVAVKPAALQPTAVAAPRAGRAGDPTAGPSVAEPERLEAPDLAGMHPALRALVVRRVPGLLAPACCCSACGLPAAHHHQAALLLLPSLLATGRQAPLIRHYCVCRPWP